MGLRTRALVRSTRPPRIARWATLTAGLVAAAGATACDPPGPTFVVDSAADSVDATPGDGVCQTATPGQCTLRAAVMELNADLDGGTILLSGLTAVLSTAGGGEDAAATGDLDVRVPITVEGGGGTVDGNLTDRVFDVVGPAGHLTTLDLTITRGSALSGGGIRGIATIIRTHLTVNRATGVVECTHLTSPVDLGTNCSGTEGGGGAVSGTLTALDSAITANSYPYPSECIPVSVPISVGMRPPIIFTGTSCPSTFAAGVQGTANLVNTTVAGNVNLSSTALSGTGTILASTIEGAAVDGPGPVPIGPILRGRYRVAGSVLGGADDIGFGIAVVCTSQTTFTSLGNNVVRDTSCGSLTGTDQTGVDPLLGPLDLHGGSTPSKVPAAASPAVGAIPTAGCTIDHDQRGETRPSGSACDAGAVERQPAD